VKVYIIFLVEGTAWGLGEKSHSSTTFCHSTPHEHVFAVANPHSCPKLGEGAGDPPTVSVYISLLELNSSPWHTHSPLACPEKRRAQQQVLKLVRG